MNTLEKAQEIVKNDVFSNLTTMVTEMMIGGDLYIDDLYMDDFCESEEETEEFEEEIQQPLEFWDVSDSLMKRLRAKGENVIQEFSLNIWCRMEGVKGRKDIHMDSVIQEIAKDI